MAIELGPVKVKKHYLLWGLAIGFFAVVFYFVWTWTPEEVEAPPQKLIDVTGGVADIRIEELNRVLQNPSFQLLKKYIGPIVPKDLGRANPFIPF